MSELPTISKFLNSSQDNFISDLYEPCLQWANQYDRGVGYFTSGWLTINARGMAEFASRNGHARWITSPIMDEIDFNALKSGLDGPEGLDYYTSILKQNVDLLIQAMEEAARNVLGWLIYDDILEMKIALPTAKLEEGDFHDKFGIFSDDKGNKLAFTSSVNDSKKGMVNYESIMVFRTWDGTGEYVTYNQSRFNDLWENRDANVRIYDLPSAVREKIFQLRTGDRPYEGPTKNTGIWKHQDDAISRFFTCENGILNMATGTGKTRTAIRILNELVHRKMITKAVITVAGTDLLDQWYTELLDQTDLQVYRYYESNKQLTAFSLANRPAILLVSRSSGFVENALNHYKNIDYAKSIIICDEVHGIGSETLVQNLRGKIIPFRYRLGLSATPDREYDEEGNQFIEKEIGPVIYEFSLEDAIRQGILCEFDYIPLNYELTDEERAEKRRIIATYNYKMSNGEAVSENKLFLDLARVNKTSMAKIPVFEHYIRDNLHILGRSIIFVETMEFGQNVQDILLKYIADYHTYYGEDDRKNLKRFSQGQLDSLLTCKRISEGIDIQSVANVILFSADRARLQTIQRIGRCLRTDKHNPNKRAVVVDFVNIPNEIDSDQISADQDRFNWLTSLALTRREEN